MTYKEKCRLLLRTDSSLRFNRGKFICVYLRKKYNIIFDKYIKLKDIEDFINTRQWVSVERALRDVLLEKEFTLPEEAEAKRREEQAKFTQEYQKKNKMAEFKKTLSPKNQKRFNTMFEDDQPTNHQKT